jgi:4-amino-4-deoxy-L-arabinose transferase-like glycosyltransferase
LSSRRSCFRAKIRKIGFVHGILEPPRLVVPIPALSVLMKLGDGFAEAAHVGFLRRMSRLNPGTKRVLYVLWLLLLCAFAVLHTLHLRADFPNHSPWVLDWAKYTDEGWYGNAAVRQHLFGFWYVEGDFNPAVALPVLPFLEWLLFFFTGVTPEAARALAVTFFLADLVLAYLLVRSEGTRWAALLAVTLMVTSPFLYSFSRLAILEPLLMISFLGALNLAVRLNDMKRPVWISVAIGVLFTTMMLTKTTAIFLLPALVWAMFLPLRHRVFHAVRSLVAALASFALTYGVWLGVVAGRGLFGDYKYMYTVNAYAKPKEFYWPLVSAVWSFHGGLWADRILIPLAGLVVLAPIVTLRIRSWRAGSARTKDGRQSDHWAGKLMRDPVFGASILSVAGYISFMAIQNHPQPRYFVLVGLFCFILVARGADAFLRAARAEPSTRVFVLRFAGGAVILISALTAGLNGARQIQFALHPEYTFVTAASQLATYIDEHPNGKRLLLSISGDQLALVNHMPALCDDFVSQTATIPDLPAKMAHYQPGWYASWNDLDPDTLEDLHVHFSLEQVAIFDAFDDPDRNKLVLFKLHPLPSGMVRDQNLQNLKEVLPDDWIQVPTE